MISKILRGLLKKVDLYLIKSDSYPDLSAITELRSGLKVNTYDCDGVIQINPEIGGVHPGPRDFIITGRSWEEKPETDAMLLRRGIGNKVFFNPLSFEKKTRETSGEHKAKTIKYLQTHGYRIGAHFEDDPVQAEIIRKNCPDIPVIMLVHGLTELENVRHADE